MNMLSTPALSAPENAAFRAMFAARKRVFVDLLKWDIPVLAGRYEVDRFDTPRARYLILLGPGGRHRASARLLPTDRPHLLGDHYAHLCDKAPPAGPAIREISRFCLDPDPDARERRDARNQLVTALVRFALRNGISDYCGVAEESWYEQVRAFGWRCERLGAPRRSHGQSLVALRIHIGADTLDGLARAGVFAPLSLRLEEGEGVAA